MVRPRAPSASPSYGTPIPGCTDVLLGSSLTAVCTTSTLAVGTDAIVAIYSGDGNYGGSSGMLSQIVNPLPVAVQFVPVTPCRLVDTRVGSHGGQRSDSRRYGLRPSTCRSCRRQDLAPCRSRSSAAAVLAKHHCGSAWLVGISHPLAYGRGAAHGLDAELGRWSGQSKRRDYARRNSGRGQRLRN